MGKYRIAVIVAGIDQNYQSAILDGLKASAVENCADMFVFVSFSGTMGNKQHDSGEMNIFSLPDFTKFDGVILMTNTIGYSPVVQNIHERVKKSGIPAVSIDNDVPEFLHIGIDNKAAMRKITEHFVKKHGFTDFSYISGPENNPESADRLSAFRDVLAENGIAVSEDRIFYGDFRGPSGKSAVNELISGGGKMPQVLICANDVMAAYAINALIKAGFRVPEDVAVSGFDNSYFDYKFRMELTTVDRPMYDSGKKACSMLIECINGIDHEHSTILEMHPCFTESCGCKKNVLNDVCRLRELNYANYNTVELIRDYTAFANKLSTDLVRCSSMEQYLRELRKFIYMIDPKEFYFCLCKNWDNETELYNYSKWGSRRNIPERYTEKLDVRIAYKCGSFFDESEISASELIPEYGIDAEGSFCYVIPLHFGERCFGYMVICDSKLPLNNSMFQSWCLTVSNSLENIRKLLSLDYAVNKLEKLYVRDTFSGIYNRNGFITATDSIYKECVNTGTPIMLMFIDLDGLKKINDTYGHNMGDKAISGIAGVLREVCVKSEVFCRFGGDEFIIFKAGADESYAAELTERINGSISGINHGSDDPFELSASIGYVIAVPDEKSDIFKFVMQADKKMYIDKRSKKHRRDAAE